MQRRTKPEPLRCVETPFPFDIFGDGRSVLDFFQLGVEVTWIRPILQQRPESGKGRNRAIPFATFRYLDVIQLVLDVKLLLSVVEGEEVRLRHHAKLTIQCVAELHQEERLRESRAKRLLVSGRQVDARGAPFRDEPPAIELEGDFEMVFRKLCEENSRREETSPEQTRRHRLEKYVTKPEQRRGF